MNSADSGPGITMARKWRIQAFNLLSPCSEKTARYFWMAICALLAIATLSIYSKTQHIQVDFEKRRLLEISLQDLIVQSMALRHLSKQYTYETKLDLEIQGYDSPQELLNQLAARLAVIEAINPPISLIKPVASLRKQLITLDQQLTKLDRPEPRQIEQWFSELAAINTTLKAGLHATDDKVNSLQRTNLLLTLSVLLFSASFVSTTLWRQSKLRERFMKELRQLRSEARTDPLTGLLNQSGWKEMTGNYLHKMQSQNQSKGSLAILDIDYFKQYNDTYGREAGDLRLKDFAESLKSNFRPNDLIARIGGEEFAVLLPECTSSDAQRIVDRIRFRGQFKVGFSAGICDIVQFDSIERTMAQADHALYQAKHRGRNRSCLSAVGT